MPNYFQNLTKWLGARNARDPLMQNYRRVNLPRKPRTKKPVAVVVACSAHCTTRCARCEQDSYCAFIMKLSYHIMIALVVDRTCGCGGSLFSTTRCALFVLARLLLCNYCEIIVHYDWASGG